MEPTSACTFAENSKAVLKKSPVIFNKFRRIIVPPRKANRSTIGISLRNLE
jgi:hypothetical protein